MIESTEKSSEPRAIVQLRIAGVLSILLAFALWPANIFADEQSPDVPSPGMLGQLSSPLSLMDGLRLDFREISKSLLGSQVQLAPRPRMSRSHGPLRQVHLLGGDLCLAECLDWGSETGTLRLLNGRTIRIPVAAVAAISNPPDEIDVLWESFETGSAVETDALQRSHIDSSQYADGERSLRIDSSSTEYRPTFSPALPSARIEFSFRIAADDSSTASGEWRLEWSGNEVKPASAIVRIDSDQRILVSGIPPATDSTFQTLAVSAGWHSFVALITPERTRLIVDDAILASFSTPRSPIDSIRFGSAGSDSKNILWIDQLQIRRLVQTDESRRSQSDSVESDVVRFASGDQVFGQLLGMTQSEVLFEAFGNRDSLPWNQLVALSWKQPLKPVHQIPQPVTGAVSQIELQPLLDRPACEAERWTVTILSSDANKVVAQHSLAGQLTFRWSDIRRIETRFHGQTVLIDARHFHLGNSIRPDFHRQLPDGTDLTVSIPLPDVPPGRAYLSLDVAELEAAGPTAPPGSPFLNSLRSGQLVTELIVDDYRVGTLNSQIRFKAKPTSPDRIRLEIPPGVLKRGENLIRLRQLPLKYPGHEFDDCEVGHFRLEFEH